MEQFRGKGVLFRCDCPDRLLGMSSNRPLRGRMSRLERPNWDPLIDLVGLELVRWFMWMGQIELVDDTVMHAYKHVATRRYFHVAEDGRLFTYRSPDTYCEIGRAEAVEDAFCAWEQVLPEPDPAALRALAELRRQVAT